MKAFLRTGVFVCACVKHRPLLPQPAPDVWPGLSLLSSQLGSYLHAKKRGRGGETCTSGFWTHFATLETSRGNHTLSP